MVELVFFASRVFTYATASTLRPWPFKCERCSTMFLGRQVTAGLFFGYDAPLFGKGTKRARESLEQSLDSGMATWKVYPCRCPGCGRFQQSTKWAVRRAALGSLALIMAVTIPMFLMKTWWIAYFYGLAIQPLRSLVSYYRQKGVRLPAVDLSEDQAAVLAASLLSRMSVELQRRYTPTDTEVFAERLTKLDEEG